MVTNPTSPQSSSSLHASSSTKTRMLIQKLLLPGPRKTLASSHLQKMSKTSLPNAFSLPQKPMLQDQMSTHQSSKRHALDLPLHRLHLCLHLSVVPLPGFAFNREGARLEFDGLPPLLRGGCSALTSCWSARSSSVPSVFAACEVCASAWRCKSF